MSDDLDVKAYLERIAYTGPLTPTLDVLRDLQRHHQTAIAFETIASFTYAPVPVDLPSLQRKVLRERRGGYCWELNLLFRALLSHVGFDVRGLLARVIMGRPEDAEVARTHLCLLVTIAGERYIADVGFGGMTPPVPLRLDTEDIQETTHEPYRITFADGRYTLRARVEQTWHGYYVFDLARHMDIDFIVANWFVSTHPLSTFRGQLVAARTEPGLRRTFRNGDYAIHRIGAPSERRTISDADAVVALLRSEFGIAVADSPDLREALHRVLPPAAA